MKVEKFFLVTMSIFLAGGAVIRASDGSLAGGGLLLLASGVCLTVFFFPTLWGRVLAAILRWCAPHARRGVQRVGTATASATDFLWQKAVTSPLFWGGVITLLLGALTCFLAFGREGGWRMGHLGGLIVSFGACLLISHFKKWETVGVAFQKKWKWAWCTGSVLAIALIFVHEWPLYSFLIAIASLVASILTIGKWWGKISWKVWMGVTFLVFIVGVSNSTVNTKTGENLVTIIYIALFFGVMYLLMKNISNTGKKKK